MGVTLVLSSACASLDAGPSFDSVAATVAERSGAEPVWARSAADDETAERAARELLGAPLDDAAAARVALLRNRTLLGQIEELGIARADYAQATRLANPTLAASLRTSDSAPGSNVELALVADLLDVLIQPARARLAAVEFEAARLRLGQTMLDLVADARTGYFDLVAAEESLERVALVRGLAQAAAELARRQAAAGNLAERDVALFEAEEAEATIDFTRAQVAAGGARERFKVLLGLSQEGPAWSVARHLPALPGAEPDLTDLERQALANRLDLGAARFGVDLVGRALALKRGTRFFPFGVEVGFSRERELDGVRLEGPQIAISLPIFDTGAASIARLEAEERRARRQLEGLALAIGSEVRVRREELLGARSLVETYEGVLLPKRRAILEQTLLHYNMMLLGVYDLLRARREETGAALAATAALREYWLARIGLERAIGSRLIDATPTTPDPSSGGER
jgi:outer membrane protein TolC